MEADESREDRLEDMRTQRMDGKTQTFAAIQRKRMRTMRQLTAARERSEQTKTVKRSIIGEEIRI